jgi:anti-anti-sigma regulatory factor
MQRATFTNLKQSDPDLLVVRVEGHLGTRQSVAVESLIEKCREKRKSKVVLEFSGLLSLGGQVAAVLRDFAAELRAQGHPLCMVGASDVVQSFLRARFDKIEPTFVADLDAAIALLQSPGQPPEPTEETAASRGAPAGWGSTQKPAPEASPREVLAVGPSLQEQAGGTDALEEPRGPQLTLVQAEELLAKGSDPHEKKQALAGLLFGVNLARTCYYFQPRGDRLVEVDDSSLWVPNPGPLSQLVERCQAMVPMVDLVESELNEQESETLTRLNCQAVLPLFDAGDLAGLLFLRKAQPGLLYEPSEALALDLLVRQLSTGQQSLAAAASARHERQVKRERYRSQTLARVSRDFNSIQDEEHLLNLLLVTLIGEMGVGSVVYYDLAGEVLRPRCARGRELEGLEEIASPGELALEEWVPTLVSTTGDPGPLADVAHGLARLGLEQAIPLRGKKGVLGLVGFGPSKVEADGPPDGEFLAALLQHAGVAVENARMFHHLQEQTLRVARTIMALLDKRVGANENPATELVVYYVGRVAQAMNYPADQLRELLYGTVLRDIGMIEVSDLVLKSPRRLTPEEWKLVQRHPTTGVEIIRAMDFSDATCDVVLHHHERFNGEGYPHGLRGTAIPLGARIVAVVESFVAMTRKLPYRAALSHQEALELLRENWEMRYDPEAVEAFIQIVEREQGKADSREAMFALL